MAKMLPFVLVSDFGSWGGYFVKRRRKGFVCEKNGAELQLVSSAYFVVPDHKLIIEDIGK